MYGSACREISKLDASGWVSDSTVASWDHQRPEAKAIPQPIKSYTRRAAHLAELRANSEWAVANADDYIRPPSDRAIECAKHFINSVSEGCLDFRMAFSKDGEINIFFGSADEMFQILIDESGTLSYFMRSRAVEYGASDISPEHFPHMQLLQFVDRNK